MQPLVLATFSLKNVRKYDIMIKTVVIGELLYAAESKADAFS